MDRQASFSDNIAFTGSSVFNLVVCRGFVLKVFFKLTWKSLMCPSFNPTLWRHYQLCQKGCCAHSKFGRCKQSLSSFSPSIADTWDPQRHVVWIGTAGTCEFLLGTILSKRIPVMAVSPWYKLIQSPTTLFQVLSSWAVQQLERKQSPTWYLLDALVANDHSESNCWKNIYGVESCWIFASRSTLVNVLFLWGNLVFIKHCHILS